MAEPVYVTIGRTRKAHGLAGELKIQIENAYLEDFLKCERIFLDVKGAKIPYFISNVRGGAELIVKLEEVNDRNAATMLQARDLLLRDKDILPEHLREFETEQEEGLQYAHLAGFMIVDLLKGEIGEISEVLEMPQQEMAFLKHRGKDVLIPLNEHFIRRIDEERKTVEMELPEGLLECV